MRRLFAYLTGSMDQNRSTVPGGRYIRLPIMVILLLFIAVIGYGSGAIYWVVKKDNDVEKYRRIELQLRYDIKEKDDQIQQFKQRVKQLERRVEILDAIEDLSTADVPASDKHRIALEVDRVSEKYGHDPFLILALMSTESTLQPRAESKVGAHGLMQLMPSTGRSLSKQVKNNPQVIGLEEGDEGTDLHYMKIDGNIQLGTLYLTKLMLQYKSLEHAIYAYNLGPTLFDKRVKTGGPYPRKYLGKVMARYAELTKKYRRSETTPTPLYAAANNLNALIVQNPQYIQ